MDLTEPIKGDIVRVAIREGVMYKYMIGLLQITMVLFLITAVAGCSVTLQKRHPSDAKRIRELNQETEGLKTQLERIKRAKEEEIEELTQAKVLLEKKLKKEIEEKEVKLEIAERGLVITFVNEVLFDSGRAKIKPEASPVLDKVTQVLSEKVPERDIGIEGHTDNEPIKYSGWKSNWELSAARATSVLHYLVDEKKIDPEKVSAIGYGEYRPVATNETQEGRQQNRRVEIIILPKMQKVKAGMEEKHEERRVYTK